MVITISAINTALAGTLAGAEGIVRVQDAAQPGIDSGGLTEGMGDLPAVQVYWQDIEVSDGAGNDRHTFGGGVRQSRLTFHADVYARQRSQIGEDAAAALALADAVSAVLDAQTAPPFFGLAGIRAFRYTAQRVTFEYGTATYAGVRFVITVWVN